MKITINLSSRTSLPRIEIQERMQAFVIKQSERVEVHVMIGYYSNPEDGLDVMFAYQPDWLKDHFPEQDLRAELRKHIPELLEEQGPVVHLASLAADAFMRDPS